MKDELWAFNWKFWALIVLIVWLATGCATDLARREVHLWNTCDGQERTTYVEIRTGFPPIACPALAAEHNMPLAAMHLALSIPLGCTIAWPGRAIVIVPPGSERGGAILEHEIRHAKGEDTHPALLPLLWVSPCDQPRG